MPKLNSRPPKLSRERNLAVVYTGGKRKSLGRWGSDEAKRNYSRFVAEWKISQQVAIVGASGQTVVEDLFLAYAEWAVNVLDSRDYGHCRTITEEIVNSYGDIPIDEFGPKALTVVQRQMELSGRFSYSYINKLLGYARTIFRWGVSQEMVSSLAADALQYVQPLRIGRTSARINPPREDVPDEVVDRTLPFLSATIAAMVRVQRLATMRPSEICRMIVGDIDRTGEIWLYRPGMHKGTWRGHHRVIALGKQEQEIILPRLEGRSDEDHVFRPMDALLEKWEKDAANRKSKVTPSQQKRKEKSAANFRRKVRGFYDADSYNQAISRALDRANKELPESEQIPRWTPYQLRHAAVTELTETEGLDVARAVAGQRTINMTQHYNHADTKIAVRMAKKRSEK